MAEHWGSDLRQLYGSVWCRTCEHSHIPRIPSVTFACGPTCGFGVWGFDIALRHAEEYPDHLVHVIHHQTVPIEEAPVVLLATEYRCPTCRAVSGEPCRAYVPEEHPLYGCTVAPHPAREELAKIREPDVEDYQT